VFLFGCELLKAISHLFFFILKGDSTAVPAEGDSCFSKNEMDCKQTISQKKKKDPSTYNIDTNLF
jgi:hypothetical protein